MSWMWRANECLQFVFLEGCCSRSVETIKLIARSIRKSEQAYEIPNIQPVLVFLHFANLCAQRVSVIGHNGAQLA